MITAPATTTYPQEGDRSLIEVTQRLSALLEAETAALGERRPEAVVALQDEKRALTEAYAQETAAARATLTAAAPEARVLDPDLEEATRALKRALAGNAEALIVAQSTAQRVVAAIAHGLEARQAERAPYGASGIGRGSGAHAPCPSAFAFDDHL